MVLDLEMAQEEIMELEANCWYMVIEEENSLVLKINNFGDGGAFVSLKSYCDYTIGLGFGSGSGNGCAGIINYYPQCNGTGDGEGYYAILSNGIGYDDGTGK